MSFLYFLSNIRTPFLTAVFRFFTLFGEEVVIFLLICLLYWCIDKKLVYCIGLTFFVSGLLVQALKITFRIDRPWVIDENFKAIEEVIDTATGYSFPSGHTQSAVAIYLTSAIYAKRGWLKALLVVLTLGVGFSRMYLGVHTPADVIAAALSSAVCIILVWFIMKSYNGTMPQDVVMSVLICVLSALCLVYALALYNSGTIEQKYVSDCAKAAGAGIGFGIAWFIEHRYIDFDTHTQKLWMQIPKFAVGMLTVLAFKEGLKYILGGEVWADALRYTIVIIWTIAVYPLIFKNIFARKTAKNT